MSEDFITREMTLEEEIKDLEKHNVPEHVRARMLKKLAEIKSWNERLEESRCSYITLLEERNRNNRALLNALGEHLHNKEPKKLNELF